MQNVTHLKAFCHPEWSRARGPSIETKVAVILSEAKDLQFRYEAN
jgi:hypothetical protein